MRSEQYLSVIIAGTLAIALVMLAGIKYESAWAIKLALVASVCMYLVQAGDALQSEYPGTPGASIANTILITAWIIAVLAIALAVVILMFS